MQKEPYLSRSPCHWASTRCSCKRPLGYIHPSRKSLISNTVLYAVQEKIPGPELLPGEDVLLDEKVPYCLA